MTHDDNQLQMITTTVYQKVLVVDTDTNYNRNKFITLISNYNLKTSRH
jgi:hypothetical protein